MIKKSITADSKCISPAKFYCQSTVYSLRSIAVMVRACRVVFVPGLRMVEELFDLLVESCKVWVLRSTDEARFEPTLTTAHHQMAII